MPCSKRMWSVLVWWTFVLWPVPIQKVRTEGWQVRFHAWLFMKPNFWKTVRIWSKTWQLKQAEFLTAVRADQSLDKHGQLWHFSHYLDDNFIWKWMGCDAKRPQKDYSSSGSNLPFWNCNQRQVTIHWAVEGWCVYLNLILSPEYFFVHGPFLCEWIK